MRTLMNIEEPFTSLYESLLDDGLVDKDPADVNFMDLEGGIKTKKEFDDLVETLEVICKVQGGYPKLDSFGFLADTIKAKGTYYARFYTDEQGDNILSIASASKPFINFQFFKAARFVVGIPERVKISQKIIGDPKAARMYIIPKHLKKSAMELIKIYQNH